MLMLTGTSAALEITTGVAGNVDVTATWADLLAADMAPGDTQLNITTAADTLVAAGIATGSRQIKSLCAFNKSAVPQTVKFHKDVSGTNYVLTPTVPLSPGEALLYEQGRGFYILDVAGRAKQVPSENVGTTGRPVLVYKVGTAPEAAGNMYCWSKDTGAPGAWSPGAPGLNGRATDGMTAADNGCLPLWTPTGALYLVKSALANSVAALNLLFDFLWVNTGLVVTTTTAQAITAVALPARDNNGANLGDNVFAALLVTAATTNAAAVTNCTISYTNSDGVAGRTGTMASFPATANIGTLVLFQLAAGDKGVRSVQSVTLGTSLVTGAVSLVLLRAVDAQSGILANVGNPDVGPQSNPGTRVFNGSCLIPVALASATTAGSLTGVYNFVER